MMFIEGLRYRIYDFQTYACFDGGKRCVEIVL